MATVANDTNIQPSENFPPNSFLVGIGASAGGLQAWKPSLAACPPPQGRRLWWCSIYRPTFVA
jgi:chemotaxis response regulator CheB